MAEDGIDHAGVSEWQKANELLTRLAPKLFEKKRLSHLRDLAYYTSASVGMEILSGGKLWLRNTRLMNDASEIHHALSAIYGAFDGSEGAERRKKIEAASPEFFKKFAEFYQGTASHIANSTYAMSLSLNCSRRHPGGRLSMWRGYGTDLPVAVVFDAQAVEQEGGTLPVYSGLVRYKDTWELIAELDILIERLGEYATEIRDLSPFAIESVVRSYLAAAACLTKRPHFIEEREFRLFHIESFPVLPPQAAGRLDFVRKVVAGRPQKVLTLKFDNYNDFKLGDLSLKRCLKYVLIGPMEQQVQVQEAYIEQLRDIFNEDARNMVRIAPIPYRPRL